MPSFRKVRQSPMEDKRFAYRLFSERVYDKGSKTTIRWFSGFFFVVLLYVVLLPAFWDRFDKPTKHKRSYTEALPTPPSWECWLSVRLGRKTCLQPNSGAKPTQSVQRHESLYMFHWWWWKCSKMRIRPLPPTQETSVTKDWLWTEVQSRENVNEFK